jgi:hypothetical protein
MDAELALRQEWTDAQPSEADLTIGQLHVISEAP